MNELTKIFSYGESLVRTVLKGEDVWFVARDVCKILEIGDVSKAVSRLDDDEKGTNSVLTHGGNQNLLTINESGLYSLILTSRKAEAKQFKRWVTHEVIPSIRKHGGYMTDQALEKAVNDPDFMIGLLVNLKEEKQKRAELELANKQKDQLIGELKPKADYTDTILKSKGIVTITQIAKDYGMSGQEMNELLHELKIQYKQSEQWLLYSKYHNKGYTHSETINITHKDGRPDVKMNTKWTQKGRLFIYNLLKDEGILPLIERQIEEVSV